MIAADGIAQFVRYVISVQFVDVMTPTTLTAIFTGSRLLQLY